ncbi:MAG: CNNM domain-containing protein [Xanthobacteraceae bacterium]|jgi:CBS domain containing-hemolysin-like protein
MVLTWIGIVLCVAQSAMFSGLNLAALSIPRLRLELEANAGNRAAQKVIGLRRDTNLLLCTIVWGNIATNVVLTLLSESVLTGVGAFVFSTFVITLFGEIFPQAYFSRNAIRVAAFFSPLIKIYQVILYIVAKPTALVLEYWLGPEGVMLFRERDFRALITRHAGDPGTDIGRLEAIGALNFLDLDDVPVGREGEPIDPRSIISLPMLSGKPVLPAFERSPKDPFLRQIDASGHKWVIFVDDASQPYVVLDAHHFLRDVLFEENPVTPERYWHRPLIVTDANTKLGEVIGHMKVRPETPEDDVVDHDLILVWANDQRRIITGADLLGRLLRGIAMVEKVPERTKA